MTSDWNPNYIDASWKTCNEIKSNVEIIKTLRTEMTNVRIGLINEVGVSEKSITTIVIFYSAVLMYVTSLAGM